VKNQFYNYIEGLQDQITSSLEAIDGLVKFEEDLWVRKEGGGGRTRIIQNGALFEKGGVNISKVHGPLPPAMQTYFNVGDVDFFCLWFEFSHSPQKPYGTHSTCQLALF